MSIEKAREALRRFGLDGRIIELEQSSATVALAALALGTEEARIAKSLSFDTPSGSILVITAGDVKIDNKKFKERFLTKAKMSPFDEVEGKIGHAPGGVCPFGVLPSVAVYLDESLKRFDTVYPAAGTSSSAVRLSIEELELSSGAACWVDVTALIPPKVI